MITIAALSGFAGVAIGAFGAHILKTQISPEMLEVYKTGVLYHLIHSVVLLALALSGKDCFRPSYYFILTGIVLFSFSLYFYSVTDVKFFAMTAPVGGISFLAGWILIVIKSLRNQDH